MHKMVKPTIIVFTRSPSTNYFCKTASFYSGRTAYFLLLIITLSKSGNSLLNHQWTKRINLPTQHMAFYFRNNPAAADRCRHDPHCPFKIHLDRDACWGYEDNCTRNWQYSYPTCLGDHHGWVTNKQKQHETFFEQGDFGYIRSRKDELFPVCKPRTKEDSILECTSYLRFCQGKQIFFNFSSLLEIPQPVRYRMDIIRKGQVGGFNCDVHLQPKEISHMSPLQSWAPELQHFISLDRSDTTCDVVVEEPTIIMKLDATVNMYHHFCDFLNLYATLHLNNSLTDDFRILIWDTIPYRGNFGDTWKAFTKHPIDDLYHYNCEDEGCYYDLARLRGIKYFTWENLDKLKPQDEGHHPTEGAHAKFTNYHFDPAEVARIVKKAAQHVLSHPQWQQHAGKSRSSPPVHTEL